MLGAITPSEHQVPYEELIQYGAMGTIIHKMAEMALKGDNNPTHLWTECKEQWETIQNGSLHLDPSKASPQAFITNYSDTYNFQDVNELEIEMLDDDLMLKGTTDLIITDKEGKRYIADWKTSRSYPESKKIQYFKQLALYALMYEKKFKKKIDGLVIFPLNPKNKSGYGSPIVSYEIEKFQTAALADLHKFNNIYKNER